jgi:hypothetical protein
MPYFSTGIANARSPYHFAYRRFPVRGSVTYATNRTAFGFSGLLQSVLLMAAAPVLSPTADGGRNGRLTSGA